MLDRERTRGSTLLPLMLVIAGRMMLVEVMVMALPGGMGALGIRVVLLS